MPLPKPQFDLLLSKLPQLSPKQAAVVSDHIAALFGESTSSTSHWLLDGAFVELRRRGLMSKIAPPLNIMKSWSKNLDNQLRGIEVFLLKAAGRNSALNPAEKAALAQICFAALCDWLIERRLPLSLRIVIMNVGNIPSALECAFPGYVAAGVLGMLLKRKA